MRFVLSLVLSCPARGTSMTTASSTGIPSMLSLPFIIHFRIFCEIFGSNAWLVSRLENVLFRTEKSARTHRRISLIAIWVSFDLAGQAPRLLWGITHLCSRKLWLCRSRGTQPKRVRKACRSLVNRVRLLPTPTNHSRRDAPMQS